MLKVTDQRVALTATKLFCSRESVAQLVVGRPATSGRARSSRDARRSRKWQVPSNRRVRPEAGVAAWRARAAPEMAPDGCSVDRATMEGQQPLTIDDVDFVDPGQVDRVDRSMPFVLMKWRHLTTWRSGSTGRGER